jgi:hypothetical protein
MVDRATIAYIVDIIVSDAKVLGQTPPGPSLAKGAKLCLKGNLDKGLLHYLHISSVIHVHCNRLFITNDRDKAFYNPRNFWSRNRLVS